MKIEVKQIPPVKVNIVKTGPQGLSAYEVWLAAGNVGTVADFLSKDQRVYQYDGTEMIINHSLGRRVTVQAITSDGKVYFPEVQHLMLDTVAVRTIAQTSLTLIIS